MRATEIVLHFDEREIEALQNALDCFSDENCTVEQKLREAFDSLYTEFVPPEMQNAIEIEILKENIARQEQIEADKRFGLFHIRENNEDRYYLNEFIQQLLAGAYRYRLYSQNKLSSEPKRFADALLGSVPITVIDYENLAERFEDEPKILSVMDFDLDEMVDFIRRCKPKQVNIGKNTNKMIQLLEPPKNKVSSLINELQSFTNVHIKNNIKDWITYNCLQEHQTIQRQISV